MNNCVSLEKDMKNVENKPSRFLILPLMRHTHDALNKFYYPTGDRNMKAKLFIQKCKDDN